MAKIKCFNPDGVMVMREACDVRELIELSGYTLEEVINERKPKGRKSGKVKESQDSDDQADGQKEDSQ